MCFKTQAFVSRQELLSLRGSVRESLVKYGLDRSPLFEESCSQVTCARSWRRKVLSHGGEPLSMADANLENLHHHSASIT